MKIKVYFSTAKRYNENGISGFTIIIGRNNPPLCVMEYDVKNIQECTKAVESNIELLKKIIPETGYYSLNVVAKSRKIRGFDQWLDSYKDIIKIEKEIVE